MSESALALLSEYRGDIPVDDSNRESCRELAAAGLLVVGHSFAGGREAFYRLTGLGLKLARVLGRINDPSPAGSAAPRP